MAQGRPLFYAKIRNKVSFHYKDDDNLTEINFQRLPDTEPWEFYLCSTNGNSFYFVSELVAQAGVIDLVKPPGEATAASELSTDAEAFGVLCDTVILVSRRITLLFGELIASLVGTSIGDDLDDSVVDLPNCPKMSTFVLPYFFDENDALRPVANKQTV